MENLEQYLFKNVVVVDKTGAIHKGYVDLYLSAEDNEDTEECIGILPYLDTKSSVGLNKSDIKSIKIVD